ncbi:MAG: hypothetical protein PHR83_00030 [Paludibacter sp.]|nr:hypothetical protein [Paludibacter sp.]
MTSFLYKNEALFPRFIVKRMRDEALLYHNKPDLYRHAIALLKVNDTFGQIAPTLPMKLAYWR